MGGTLNRKFLITQSQRRSKIDPFLLLHLLSLHHPTLTHPTLPFPCKVPGNILRQHNTDDYLVNLSLPAIHHVLSLDWRAGRGYPENKSSQWDHTELRKMSIANIITISNSILHSILDRRIKCRRQRTRPALTMDPLQDHLAMTKAHFMNTTHLFHHNGLCSVPAIMDHNSNNNNIRCTPKTCQLGTIPCPPNTRRVFIHFRPPRAAVVLIQP